MAVVTYQNAAPSRPAITFAKEGWALSGRMTNKPPAARQRLNHALISDLKVAGVWQKLDGFYMLASHDEQSALLNWVQNAYNLTKQGAITFAANVGFTGNGSTGYLATGFNATTAVNAKLKRDSAHISLVSNTSGQSNAQDMGTTNLLIQCRNTGNMAALRVNAASNTSPTSLDGAGHFIASRTAASAGAFYKDGTRISTAVGTSVDPDNAELRILGRGGTTSVSVRQGVCATFGAGLTQTEANALNAAIRKYLSSLEELVGADGLFDFVLDDVVVHGATASGIMAAIAAARRGDRVRMISPNGRRGGLVTAGLVRTDYKGYTPNTWLNNLGREFYGLVATHYGKTLGELAFSGTAQLAHEPKVAEKYLRQLLRKAGVRVIDGYRVQSVSKVGTEIRSVTLELAASPATTRVLKAPRWIDGSYECDLIMRVPGLTWTYGRESNATYGETWNGVRVPGSLGISPYVTAGDPGSGLLPFFTAAAALPAGSNDNKLQAFGHRLVLTNDPTNQRPWPAPAVYNALWYEGLGRRMEADPTSFQSVSGLFLPVAIPSAPTKFDFNNKGVFSLDFVGGNAGFVTLDYAARQAILDDHVNYTLGLVHFIKTDPRVPAAFLADFNKYGLCADEFANDNATGMSPEVYLRETVRMVGDYVAGEGVYFKTDVAAYPVAYGSYPMDVHACQYHDIGGVAYVEGGLPTTVSANGLFGLDYRVLLPKAAECTNLLACCNGISVSHILWASVRMEPILMALGEAAGVAASLSRTANRTLHSLSGVDIQPLVRPEKIVPTNVLVFSTASGMAPPSASGYVEISDPAHWTFGVKTILDYWGQAYAEASSGDYGTKWVRGFPNFGATGTYRLRLNLPLDVTSKSWVRIDVKDRSGLRPPIYQQFKGGSTWFADIGTYDFLDDGTEYIQITNANKPGVSEGGRMQSDAVAWELLA